jgi:DNA-binding PadR family transcriptional regulator
VSGTTLNATAMSLLGFLHEGPLTGWSLVATAQEEIGDFWSVTQSQVYRELATMARLGLVEAGERGPRDRRPYAITDAGREAFAEWLLVEPGAEIIRFPLLLTVLFGRYLPAGRLGAFIDAHRSIHRARRDGYLEHLRDMEEAPRGKVDPYALATLKFGLAYETMVLDWMTALPKELTGGSARRRTKPAGAGEGRAGQGSGRSPASKRSSSRPA